MVSIKTKLSVLVAASVLCTAGVLGSLNIMHLRRTAQQHSQSTMRLAGLAETGQVNLIMGNIQQSANIMKSIILGMVEDVETFASDGEFRERVTREMEAMFYSVAYYTEGAISFYVRYNPELTDSKSGFLWVKSGRSSSFFKMPTTDMALYDRDDVEHVGWYYVPVQNGKPTWMRPYLNRNLGIYMISYVIPLYIDGTVIGVVGMDIDFSVLIQTVVGSLGFEGGYVYILDDTGTVVYHPFHSPGTAGISREPGVLEQTQALDNGWSLTVAVPEEEFNAGRRRLVLMLVIASALIVAVAVAVSLLLTMTLIRPLLELTSATQKIAEGDLNVELSCDSNDEIGILAASFRKTVRHLPEYMYRDSLTGVRNVASYRRTVSRLEERMRTESPRFAVAVLDVNNLKLTNDRYGHEAGNQLIVTAARLICRVFAHSPVFRIGGDEFVVLLEGADYEGRGHLVRRFDAECSEAAVSVAADVTLPVSVARGVSRYEAGTDAAYADVFNRADGEMYCNKKAVKERMGRPQ